LDSKCFAKLSSLLANKIKTRTKTIAILQQITANQSFRTWEAVNVLLPHLLRTFIPEGISELIAPILRLLQGIVAIHGLKATEIGEAANQLPAIQLEMITPDVQIVESALSLPHISLCGESHPAFLIWF
jgi:hypothetical protein